MSTCKGVPGHDVRQCFRQMKAGAVEMLELSLKVISRANGQEAELAAQQLSG